MTGPTHIVGGINRMTVSATMQFSHTVDLKSHSVYPNPAWSDIRSEENLILSRIYSNSGDVTLNKSDKIIALI